MAIIGYETLFALKADCYDRTAVSAESTEGNLAPITLRLSTTEFQVQYRDGQASIELTRHLSLDAARTLGDALIKEACRQEEATRKWHEDNEEASK